jgi:CBS-domain-containing membrane protein
MKKLKSFKVQSRVCKTQVLWSWIGAFTGIALVSVITSFALEGTGMTLIIGSFGASAVLIYGAVDSPLAQPRNLLGGHIFSALVGVIAFQLFSEQIWMAAPMAVATAIAIMQFTDTLHPPGGATALIAVIGGEQIHHLGYIYVFFPVATGAVLMLFVALLVNHIAPGRTYPQIKKQTEQ